MFASPLPKPPVPVVWAILAAYAVLALQIAFGSLLLEAPRNCSPLSPAIILARISAVVANFGLIAYVTAYGRWKVLWLAPQILITAAIIMAIAQQPLTDNNVPDDTGVCFVTV